MSFLKKVVVLKELESGFAHAGKKISGIARIETSGGVSELHLSLINISAVSGGTFIFFIIDDCKSVFTFELGKRPFAHSEIFPIIPSIERGFSAGLCFVKDDLPLTVAFSATENSPVSLTDFKRLVADKCLEQRRKCLREQVEVERFSEKPIPEQKNQTPIPNTATSYDDEAVATENYYALTEEINDKIELIKETDNARLRNEDAMFNERCQEKTQKGGETTYRVQDETDADYRKDDFKEPPYYHTVKAELLEIFQKFPPEKQLNALFADSTWARVKYFNDKYYVVGLVKENGVEKYICYGVPSKYSPEPPKELKGSATFIPLSVFDLKGDGYWMMFQDAVTGNCIRLVKNKT